MFFRISLSLMAIMAGLLAVVPSRVLAQAEERARPYAELEPIEFVLADVRYQIHLPRRSRLMAVSDPGCVDIRHPNAVRTMTFLELCASPTLAPATYSRHATLSTGIRVRYNVDRNIGGGSGGTEGEIKGEFHLEGRVFGLRCRDQGEWRNNPQWCLLYLPYLQVSDRK